MHHFVNLMDLGPTFCEVGGIEIPKSMCAKSLLPILLSDESGQVDPSRDFVVTGRERHVHIAREKLLRYPQRAIREKDYIYFKQKDGLQGILRIYMIIMVLIMIIIH